MAYLLISAPAPAAAQAAAATSTTNIAGPARLAPLGTILAQPSTIVGTREWQAKQAAQQAGQRLAARHLTVGVSGLVTTPELHLEDLAERGAGYSRY